MPKRIAIYSAAFLDDREAGLLLAWWEQNVSPLLEDTFAHHMTIKFKPSNDEVGVLPIGATVDLKVAGYVDTPEVQAVVVRGLNSTNDVPHITVATDGGKPFRSNKALAEGYTRTHGPVLRARVGYWTNSGAQYDLPEGIKPDGI